MPRVEVSTHIARPPEAVHAMIQDFDRYPEWITFTKEVLKVEGDGGPGTKYWERGTGGKSSWEVTELVPGKREVHTGDIGIASVRIDMTLKATGKGKNTGTDYSHVIEYDMKVPVLGAIIDRLVLNRTMRKNMEKTVANLKRILEASRD